MKRRINKIVLAVALFITAFVIIVDTETYSWLFHGWQSGDSRVTFTADTTTDPRFTMWLYDKKEEGASNERWTQKYGDTNTSNPTEKALPKIADFGTNSISNVNKLQLQFGFFDNLAEVEEYNCAYMRYEIYTNEHSFSTVVVDYALNTSGSAYDYISLYRENGSKIVDSDIINKLNSTSNGQLKYPLYKAYYAISGSKLDPTNASQYTTLKNLFANNTNVLSIGAAKETIPFMDNTAGDTKASKYLYIKLVPDLEGIKKAYMETKLPTLGRMYAVMSFKLDIDVHIEEP